MGAGAKPALLVGNANHCIVWKCWETFELQINLKGMQKGTICGYESTLYLIRGNSNQKLEIKQRGCRSKADVIESVNHCIAWKCLETFALQISLKSLQEGTRGGYEGQTYLIRGNSKPEIRD